MSSPNAALLRELRGVTRDATALSDLLKTLNGLPDDFPEQSLIDICGALVRLPLGSAEGCKVQLDYAHRRLPGIRRAHILDEEDLPKTAADVRPPVMRDSPLDDRIAKLAFSVSSARELFSDPETGALDNEIVAERPLPTAGVPEVGEAIEVADNVEARFDANADELGEIAKQDSAPAIALGQHMRDVSGFARLTRAELRLGAFLGSQLTSLRYGTLNALDAIKHDLQRMARGVVFLNGYIQQGRTLLKRIKEGDITVVNDLICKIVWAIERAERALAPKINGNERSEDLELELTQAAAEAQARALILAGEPVPPRVARLVRRLDLSGSPVQKTVVPDLRLVLGLTDLEELILVHSVFGNFDVVASLQRMTTLKIDVSLAKNLAPLSALNSLVSLTLYTEEAKDLSPLAALRSLRSMILFTSKATDLGPLSALTSLTSLIIPNFKGADLGPLGALTDLTSLSLSAQNSRDISPLGRLTALKALELNMDRTDDLAPLTALNSLIALNISVNNATDLGPLGRLVHLRSLQLSANRATNLAPLARLTSLTSLSLSARNAVGLAPLGALNNLTELIIFDTEATDLSPLSALTALERVSLGSYTRFNLSAMAELKRLRRIDLSRAHPDTDMTPIAHVPEIIPPEGRERPPRAPRPGS